MIRTPITGIAANMALLAVLLPAVVSAQNSSGTADAGFCNPERLRPLVNERLQIKTVSFLTDQNKGPEILPPLGTGTDTLLTGYCRIEASASAAEDSLINFEV